MSNNQRRPPSAEMEVVMEFARTKQNDSRSRPLQKKLAKDRRAVIAVDGRVSMMTYRNYVLKRWLPLTEMGVEPVTAESYRRQMNNYILPALGHVRVGSLDRATIQGFYADLLRNNSPFRGRPLGKGTVIRIHCMVHASFEDLVQTGQLSSNPARGLRPRHTKSERYEYTIWSEAELASFLDQAKNHPLFPLWRVMAFTGLRRGEALGLKRSDVRLDQRQLCVRRAVGIVDRDLYITRPKTDAERVIELDGETAKVLKRHLRKIDPRPEAWVFGDGVGDLIEPSRVSVAFKDLIATMDLPRIRLHDLRHTHASHLILAGVNVKAVQERLGHSDVVVTLNIYSHVLPTTQRDAVKQLERFYGSAR